MIITKSYYIVCACRLIINMEEGARLRCNSIAIGSLLPASLFSISLLFFFEALVQKALVIAQIQPTG
jgi:hypothetical protein